YSDAFREKVRARFHGPIIGAGAYTPEKAEDLIEKGLIDAVAFDTTTTINNIVLLNDTGVQNDQLTNVAKPSFRIDVPGDVIQVR
ncbi:hypothetical protein MJH54_34110, partial [Salmonella enterica subsp. enterica serovar Montevideo]|nr:hypothetical protein [Salmonella enterica subsp. enterica serovar Montevideo]